jgi:hypothetical protein
MATRKPKTADDSTLAEARALVDLPEHGVKAGHLLEADPSVMLGLVSTGLVDMHPDAVAYAKVTPD